MGAAAALPVDTLPVALYTAQAGRLKRLACLCFNGISIQPAKSMSSPAFSVIMPVWNRAGCIRPSIESVAGQTRQDYELLIIDDGSDDGLERAVRPFLSDAIRYYRRPHLGVSAARNFGIGQARGAYIAYLDSDNTWHPGFLATMYKALRSSPHPQAAYCKYNRFKKNATGGRQLESVQGEDFDFKKLVSGNFIDLNTFVHTQEALNGSLRFDEALKRLNDWDFILKITRQHRPVFVKKTLVDYNCGLARNTITSNEDFFGPMITIKKRYREFVDRIALVNHDGISYRFENIPDKKYYNYLITSHQSERDTRDFTAPGFPYMLQIEPTNFSNLSCTVCPAAANKNDLNRERRHLRLGEFKKIVDDMQDYLLFLVMWEWGEPFLNPELPDMIRYASDRGIKTVTSTNAHFLHDSAYLERILSSGLSTLIIAIDSLKSDSYEYYRRGGNLEKALAGLENVVALKEKLHSATRINLRMVLMKSNENERDDMRRLARRLKVDTFTVKTAFPNRGASLNDELIVPTNPEHRHYAYKPGTFERIRTGGPCTKPWFMFNIHSNGNVVACNYVYTQEMVVGNAFERPLTEIWNSHACRNLRKKLFYDKDTLPKCRECDINFKLSRSGWFVEVGDLHVSARTRFSRALRRRAGKTLPAPASRLFNGLYRTLDAAAIDLKKRLSAPARSLSSAIFPLRLPLPADYEKGWCPCPLFSGTAKASATFGCHVSALVPECSPHPPHAHPEEELLLLLSGALDLIVPEERDPQKTRRLPIAPQHALFYPAGSVHTLQATGPEPANYLMLKWQNKKQKKCPPLTVGPFDLRARASDPLVQEGMRRRLVFEGRTAYLKKLHCHVSTLAPQAGYAPHADPYDVIIVVLEGRIETLGRTASAHAVIFYAAGEPHGIRNPSATAPAHYAVFELHRTR